MDKILNYINGNFVEANSKKWINNYDPSTGEVYSLIPDSEKIDVELAQSAAQAAFDSWSSKPIHSRSK